MGFYIIVLIFIPIMKWKSNELSHSVTVHSLAAVQDKQYNLFKDLHFSPSSMFDLAAARFMSFPV